MDIYSKYPVVVDMYGQIGNLTELKMPWLEEADFVLKYQVTKDERKSFHFEMKTNYSTEDCKRKLVISFSFTASLFSLFKFNGKGLKDGWKKG